MDIPLVSIGLPVRNGAQHLDEALLSLRGQDHAHLEIIVSDNDSTDDTVAILERHAASDARVHVHRQSSNIGMAPNYEYVFAQASGAFFMFAAADDVWDPSFVSSLVARLLSEPAALGAGCGVELIDESGKASGIVASADSGRSQPTSPLRLALAIARGWTKMNYLVYGLFRREMLRPALRFTDAPAADRLFALQLSMAGTIVLDPAVLLRRRVHERALRDRYQDETSRMLAGHRWARLRYVTAIPPYILGSPAIPLRRKAWLPLLLVQAAISLLPPWPFVVGSRIKRALRSVRSR